jgi:ERCC4-type nuclease
VADYIAGAALVERKSVRDLHLAIIQGRFWPQIGRLSRTTMRPYLLVEGTDLDAGPLSGGSVRGALLAVTELGIGVIWSSGPADSALWLKILANRQRRRHKVTRIYAQRPTTSEAAEAMLAAVPGISTVTAQALLEHFGSVAAVLDASPEEWLSIRSVGPKRMQALSETLARRERHA